MTERWRLPPRSSGDTDGDVQRVLEKLENGGNDNDLLRLIANSTVAFRPFVLMSDALLVRSTFPPAIRELVILRCAARLGIDYMRHEHETLVDAVGIPSSHVAAVAQLESGDTEHFSAEERLALRITDHLLTGGRLLPEDWEAMGATWGQEQALDLLIVIGWWGGLVPIAIRGLEGHGLTASPTRVDQSDREKEAT